MRKLAVLLLGAWVLTGCGSSSDPSGPSPVNTPAPDATPTNVPPPDFRLTSKLGLIRPQGQVQVGQDTNAAFEVFVEPPGSYERSELPPRLASPYEATGWQSQKPVQGFGAISYQGKLAAAVYEIEKISEERLSSQIAAYRSRFGNETDFLPGEHVRYWFWRETNHVLMLCAVAPTKNLINLTEAVGTMPVMDALNMTPEAASRDLIRAERAFGTPKGASSKNPGAETNRADR